MPTRFDLPVLDGQDYDRLFTDMRDAIPRYSDSWTDFNDSDPGITLLQLLAFVGDATLYRIDRLPRALYLNFARLVLGTGYDGTGALIETLEDDVIRDAQGRTIYLASGEASVMDPARLALARLVALAERDASVGVDALRTACLGYLRHPYRAVTASDIDAIALEMTAPVDPVDNPWQKLVRAVSQPLPDRLRVVLVPAYVPALSVTATVPQAGAQLRATLSGTMAQSDLTFALQQMAEVVEAAEIYFAPRILLGSALEFVAVGRLAVSLRGALAVKPGADPAATLSAAYEAVAAWLDPVSGGPDGTGWSVGRPVADHDLVVPLKGVEGIDHAQPLAVTLRGYAAVDLGASMLGATAPIGVDPKTAVPMITDVALQAVDETWPMQLGLHARVGIDTALPRRTGGADG